MKTARQYTNASLNAFEEACDIIDSCPNYQAYLARRYCEESPQYKLLFGDTKTGKAFRLIIHLVGYTTKELEYVIGDKIRDEMRVIYAEKNLTNLTDEEEKEQMKKVIKTFDNLRTKLRKDKTIVCEQLPKHLIKYLFKGKQGLRNCIVFLNKLKDNYALTLDDFIKSSDNIKNMKKYVAMNEEEPVMAGAAAQHHPNALLVVRKMLPLVFGIIVGIIIVYGVQAIVPTFSSSGPPLIRTSKTGAATSGTPIYDQFDVELAVDFVVEINDKDLKKTINLALERAESVDLRDALIVADKILDYEPASARDTTAAVLMLDAAKLKQQERIQGRDMSNLTSTELAVGPLLDIIDKALELAEVVDDLDAKQLADEILGYLPAITHRTIAALLVLVAVPTVSPTSSDSYPPTTSLKIAPPTTAPPPLSHTTAVEDECGLHFHKPIFPNDGGGQVVDNKNNEGELEENSEEDATTVVSSTAATKPTTNLTAPSDELFNEGPIIPGKTEAPLPQLFLEKVKSDLLQNATVDIHVYIHDDDQKIVTLSLELAKAVDLRDGLLAEELSGGGPPARTLLVNVTCDLLKHKTVDIHVHIHDDDQKLVALSLKLAEAVDLSDGLYAEELLGDGPPASAGQTIDELVLLNAAALKLHERMQVEICSLSIDRKPWKDEFFHDEFVLDEFVLDEFDDATIGYGTTIFNFLSRTIIILCYYGLIVLAFWTSLMSPRLAEKFPFFKIAYPFFALHLWMKWPRFSYWLILSLGWWVTFQ
jgi:hypothetical protein